MNPLLAEATFLDEDRSVRLIDFSYATGHLSTLRHSDAHKVTLRDLSPQVIHDVQPQEKSFEEQIFASLVSLKVAVSQFAMHLTAEERSRIFAELDSVINVDDWHEGDQLPKVEAFEDFLKWMIYSKYFRWISIGSSNDGGLLVAWKTPYVLLTAKFSGGDGFDAVRWTARLSSGTEVGHAAGKCPLKMFTSQALFYLEGPERHGGIESS